MGSADREHVTVKINHSVAIPPDEDGYTGRECPKCEKYFKIKFGTGLPKATDCHCPYCNHVGPQSEFFTKEQIEYAKSVLLNAITSDLVAGLKRLEKETSQRGLVSIAIKVKGRTTPIAYYSERQLEERIACRNCTLQYAIYGAFAHCPDCGVHNSIQILSANFDVVLRTLDLSRAADSDVARQLVEDALENAVSCFDGFGREHCSRLPRPRSFQDIERARDQLKHDLGVDIGGSLDSAQWRFLCEQFQKRHVISHKMGVMDSEYVQRTNSPVSLVGRKVSISNADVHLVVDHLRVVANDLVARIPR